MSPCIATSQLVMWRQKSLLFINLIKTLRRWEDTDRPQLDLQQTTYTFRPTLVDACAARDSQTIKHICTYVAASLRTKVPRRRFATIWLKFLVSLVLLAYRKLTWSPLRQCYPDVTRRMLELRSSLAMQPLQRRRELVYMLWYAKFGWNWPSGSGEEVGFF